MYFFTGNEKNMTTFLFDLNFVYQDDNGNHYFQIGYFSSEQKVHEAILMLQSKPGFVNFTDGFCCEQVEVETGNDDLDIVQTTFYELSYEEFNAGDGYDYFELIGVYSSYALALGKQQELLQSNEKTYSVDGFTIAPFDIDCMGWTEGFDSW